MENFNQIFNENRDNVQNYIFYKTHNNEVAEELTNDVFMKVYNNIESYDSNISKLSTWIINIAKNTVIDYYRKRKLDCTPFSLLSKNIDSEEKEISFDVCDEKNPLGDIVDSERIKDLSNLILSLPKTYKRIANLYFNHNMSYNEISIQTKTSLSSVKVKLFRTRKMLRESIGNLN